MAKHSAIFVSGTTLPVATPTQEGMVKAGTGLSVDANGVMSVVNALTNPMTTPGDMIVSGSAGAPQRLAKGANGQVLTMVAGEPAYATPASQLPAPGTNGHVLTIVGGVPAYAAPTGGGGGGGLTNPMTTQGDIIVGSIAGDPSRLPPGLEGQILGIVGGVPAYVSPTGVSPASAIQIRDETSDAIAPFQLDAGAGSPGWGAGQSLITWAEPARRLGNVFKFTAGLFDSQNLPNPTGVAIFAADGVTTGVFTVELVVNSVVVASTNIEITNAALPADPMVDPILVYQSASPLTYEMRPGSLDPVNVELRIAGISNASVVFYADSGDLLGAQGDWGTGRKSTRVAVAEWDYSYKLSGITISSSNPGYIHVPSVTPDGATVYPSRTYDNSPCGETSPSWGGHIAPDPYPSNFNDPSSDMRWGLWSELGHPESWHQAWVPEFTGATYKWEVKGAWVNTNDVECVVSAGHRVFYIAQIYSDIDISCEITLSTGETHKVYKHIPVYHSAGYTPASCFLGNDDSTFLATYLPLKCASLAPQQAWHTIVGLKRIWVSSYLWKRVASTGSMEVLSSPGTVPMLSNSYAYPRLVPLSNDKFVVTYRGGGPDYNGSYNGWGVVNADGDLQFNGFKEFPTSEITYVYAMAFTDAGDAFGTQMSNMLNGQGRTIVRCQQDDTLTTWNLPADVVFVSLTMDPTQTTDFILYGYESTTKRVMKIDLTLAVPVITPVANCVSTLETGAIEESFDSQPGQRPQFVVGGQPRVDFRNEDGVGPMLYVWGSLGNGTMFQVNLTTTEAKIIVNRRGLTEATFPHGTYDFYARAELRDTEAERNYAKSIFWGSETNGSPSEGDILVFRSPNHGYAFGPLEVNVFDQNRHQRGVTELSPTVIRNGNPCRVTSFKVVGEPGDVSNLECLFLRDYMNTYVDFNLEIHPNANTLDTDNGDDDLTRPMIYRGYQFALHRPEHVFRIFTSTVVPNFIQAINLANTSMQAMAERSYADSQMDPQGRLVALNGSTFKVVYTYNAKGALASKMVAIFKQGYGGTAYGTIPLGVKFWMFYNSDYSITATANSGGEGGI